MPTVLQLLGLGAPNQIRNYPAERIRGTCRRASEDNVKASGAAGVKGGKQVLRRHVELP